MKKVGSVLVMLTVFLVMVVSPVSALDEAAEVSQPGFLDPEILDGFFSISEYDGPVIGIEEVPVIDEVLSAFDEVSPVYFELGFSVASAYIWRGQNLGSDASFQPYVTAGIDAIPAIDFSFTYWTDITKNSPDRNQREVDYALDFNINILEGLELFGYDTQENPYLLTKLFDFTFDTGYIYYDFPPDGGSKSQEVYFGVEYNLPLSPSFFIYNDWDRGRGAWLEWGISQDIDLGLFTLATYATLGYNKGQWGADSQFSTLDFGGSIPIALGKHTTIEPFISFTKELDDDGAGLVNDELYGGMNFSIAF
jgi:hypothetical protein